MKKTKEDVSWKCIKDCPFRVGDILFREKTKKVKKTIKINGVYIEGYTYEGNDERYRDPHNRGYEILAILDNSRLEVQSLEPHKLTGTIKFKDWGTFQVESNKYDRYWSDDDVNW